MAVVGYFFIRNKRTVRRQNWLQSGQTELSEVLGGEQRLEQLGENVLQFLAEYVDAQAGHSSPLCKTNSGVLRRTVCQAKQIFPIDLTLVTGYLGRRLKTIHAFVNDVPDGYLTFGSALFKGKPRHLVIVPVSVDGTVNAIFELGFIHPYDRAIVELFERLSESIGVAVLLPPYYRAHLQDLTRRDPTAKRELQTQSGRVARFQRGTRGAESSAKGVARSIGTTASGARTDQRTA